MVQRTDSCNQLRTVRWGAYVFAHCPYMDADVIKFEWAAFKLRSPSFHCPAIMGSEQRMLRKLEIRASAWILGHSPFAVSLPSLLHRQHQWPTQVIPHSPYSQSSHSFSFSSLCHGIFKHGTLGPVSTCSGRLLGV